MPLSAKAISWLILKESPLTVPVRIERVAVAAVLYVSDPECAMALAELEDAVDDLASQPVEAGSALASVLMIVGRLPRQVMHPEPTP